MATKEYEQHTYHLGQFRVDLRPDAGGYFHAKVVRARKVVWTGAVVPPIVESRLFGFDTEACRVGCARTAVEEYERGIAEIARRWKLG